MIYSLSSNFVDLQKNSNIKQIKFDKSIKFEVLMFTQFDE